MVANAALSGLKLNIPSITQARPRPPIPLSPQTDPNLALPDIAALPSFVHDDAATMPDGFRPALRWFLSNLFDALTGQITLRGEYDRRRTHGAGPSARQPQRRVS